MIFGGKNGLIKRHKPRGFKYAPIYYKPEEDQDEVTRKKMQAHISGDAYTGTTEDALRERIRKRWKLDDNDSRKSFPVRKMYIYVAAIIVIVMFWLLR